MYTVVVLHDDAEVLRLPILDAPSVGAASGVSVSVGMWPAKSDVPAVMDALNTAIISLRMANGEGMRGT